MRWLWVRRIWVRGIWARGGFRGVRGDCAGDLDVGDLDVGALGVGALGVSDLDGREVAWGGLRKFKVWGWGM